LGVRRVLPVNVPLLVRAHHYVLYHSVNNKNWVRKERKGREGGEGEGKKRARKERRERRERESRERGRRGLGRRGGRAKTKIPTNILQGTQMNTTLVIALQRTGNKLGRVNRLHLNNCL
jgi:hypothetical protein